MDNRHRAEVLRRTAVTEHDLDTILIQRRRRPVSRMVDELVERRTLGIDRCNVSEIPAGSRATLYLVSQDVGLIVRYPVENDVAAAAASQQRSWTDDVGYGNTLESQDKEEEKNDHN